MTIFFQIAFRCIISVEVVKKQTVTENITIESPVQTR
jgi:hypothetical protein